MIICPICKKELIKEEKRYSCCNGHSFDISKQGHANLLLSNQKNSKIPGDNKEMVLSRKQFLEKGNYQGISDEVNKVFLKYLAKDKKISILDIGCGEGYYTDRLKRFLNRNEVNSDLIAIDISKEAVMVGAKTYKEMTWLVASATSLPISDESLDFILCMFAKIDPAEFYRTLKKGGKLIVVSTGENHLEDMKAVVYDVVKKEFYLPANDENLKNLKHIESITHGYKTKIIGNETIKDLFNMTPYKWRSPQKGVEKLFALNELETTVEVTIDIFEKQ